MKQILNTFWRKNGINIVAMLLLIFGFLSGIGGYLSIHTNIDISSLINEFYSNISVELISTAIIVLVVDRLANKRKEINDEERLKKVLKKELIVQAKSQINLEALKAIEKLAVYGWLVDKSLHNIDLSLANWENVGLILENASLANAILKSSNLRYAWLYNINFESADLRWANIENANIFKTNFNGTDFYHTNFNYTNFYKTDLRNTFLKKSTFKMANILESNLADAKIEMHQLAKANRLRGSIMPNSARYNGCLNLIGDIEDAKEKGINVNISQNMANWYVVSIEEYEDGQKWANENH